MDCKIAFPLHPEYRTLPMVWYVPPLSPITAAANAGQVGANGEIPDVNQLRTDMNQLRTDMNQRFDGLQRTFLTVAVALVLGLAGIAASYLGRRVMTAGR